MQRSEILARVFSGAFRLSVSTSLVGGGGEIFNHMLSQPPAVYSEQLSHAEYQEPTEQNELEPDLIFGNKIFIYNLGARYRIQVNDSGFVDKNGNYCPGGTGQFDCEPDEAPEGLFMPLEEVFEGSRPENRKFIESMVEKYSPEKSLEIFFYDRPVDGSILVGAHTVGEFPFLWRVDEKEDRFQAFVAPTQELETFYAVPTYPASYLINHVIIANFLAGNYPEMSSGKIARIDDNELYYLAFGESKLEIVKV